MNMLKSMKFFAFLLVAFFITASAQAQSDQGPSKKDRTAGAQQKSREHHSKWQDELNLTPEQKAKIKAADDDYNAKSKASREAKRNDMDKLRAERDRAHRSVLTPEQAKKYDEIKARKAAKKEDKQMRKQTAKPGKGKGRGKEKEQGEGRQEHKGTEKSSGQ